MPKPLFSECSNTELRHLIDNLFQKRVPTPFIDEMILAAKAKKRKKTRGSQMRFLNREDLLAIVYNIVAPEVTEIDNCPEHDLPKLINRMEP